MSDRIDTLVTRLAPASAGQAALRVALLTLVLTVGAFFYEITVFGGLQGPLWQHVLQVLVLAVPTLTLIMILLVRLNGLQDRLARLASTDMLTDLPNRRAFLDIGPPVEGGVVLLLDVDHFKRVNDRFGHDVGDACLRAVADHLRAVTRRGDHVARLGGEEFGVILVAAPMSVAREIGQRLSAGFCFGVPGEEERLRITLSVGAIDWQPAASLTDLISRADAALYAAKNGGRARLVVWRPDLPVAA